MVGSYTRFTNGTIANADLVNDNFAYLKAGLIASQTINNYLTSAGGLLNTPSGLYDDFFDTPNGSGVIQLTYGTKEYYKATPGSFTFVSAPVVTTTNTGSLLGFINYEFYNVIDEFNDSSLNLTTWGSYGISGSTSVSESGESVSISAIKGNGGGTNYGSLITSGDYSGSPRVFWRYTATMNGGDSGFTSTVDMRLTDGTNTATIYSDSITGDSSSQTVLGYVNGTVDVSVDWANKKAYYIHRYFRLEGGQASGHIGLGESDSIYNTVSGSLDLTSFTTLKYQFRASSNTGTGNAQAALTLNYIRAGKTAPNSVGSFFISADNGANYNSIENGLGVITSNTGSRIYMKFTGSVATNEGVAIHRCIHGKFQ